MARGRPDLGRVPVHRRVLAPADLQRDEDGRCGAGPVQARRRRPGRPSGRRVVEVVVQRACHARAQRSRARLRAIPSDEPGRQVRPEPRHQADHGRHRRRGSRRPRPKSGKFANPNVVTAQAGAFGGLNLQLKPSSYSFSYKPVLARPGPPLRDPEVPRLGDGHLPRLSQVVTRPRRRADRDGRDARRRGRVRPAPVRRHALRGCRDRPRSGTCRSSRFHFQPCIWQVSVSPSMLPKRDRSAFRCGQRFCSSHPSSADRLGGLELVLLGEPALGVVEAFLGQALEEHVDELVVRPDPLRGEPARQEQRVDPVDLVFVDRAARRMRGGCGSGSAPSIRRTRAPHA